MKHGLYFQSSRTDVFSETVSIGAAERAFETPAAAVYCNHPLAGPRGPNFRRRRFIRLSSEKAAGDYTIFFHTKERLIKVNCDAL